MDVKLLIFYNKNDIAKLPWLGEIWWTNWTVLWCSHCTAIISQSESLRNQKRRETRSGENGDTKIAFRAWLNDSLNCHDNGRQSEPRKHVHSRLRDRELQSQTKDLGHEASSPLPPLSMLIIRLFFPFLLEKTRYFPTLIRGEGGCVIQFKCPNYFWLGL